MPAKRDSEYQIDIEAVARMPLNSQIDTVDHLLTVTANPAWDRDPMCGRCENFNATEQSIEDIPRRPGAVDPTVRCAGCIYSTLDEYRKGKEMDATTLQDNFRSRVGYLGSSDIGRVGERLAIAIAPGIALGVQRGFYAAWAPKRRLLPGQLRATWLANGCNWERTRQALGRAGVAGY